MLIANLYVKQTAHELVLGEKFQLEKQILQQSVAKRKTDAHTGQLVKENIKRGVFVLDLYQACSQTVCVGENFQK